MAMAPSPLRSPEPLPAIAKRVRAEYLEMPELSLTVRQAARLWNLDPSLCRHVLERLAQGGFLAATRRGVYRRAAG
jgi:predicted transcriptional regulator of viral defense system